MNLTRKQTIERIATLEESLAELKVHVNELDAKQIREVQYGEIYDAPEKPRLVILPCGWFPRGESNYSVRVRYSFGGLDNTNPCVPFSSGCQKGMSLQEVLEYLNEHEYEKIGTVTF